MTLFANDIQQLRELEHMLTSENNIEAAIEDLWDVYGNAEPDILIRALESGSPRVQAEVASSLNLDRVKQMHRGRQEDFARGLAAAVRAGIAATRDRAAFALTLFSTDITLRYLKDVVTGARLDARDGRLATTLGRLDVQALQTLRLMFQVKTRQALVEAVAASDLRSSPDDKCFAAFRQSLAELTRRTVDEIMLEAKKVPAATRREESLGAVTAKQVRRPTPRGL